MEKNNPGIGGCARGLNGRPEVLGTSFDGSGNDNQWAPLAAAGPGGDMDVTIGGGGGGRLGKAQDDNGQREAAEQR